jgi:hypothetical protein
MSLELDREVRRMDFVLSSGLFMANQLLALGVSE